jgi:hypothetical protein
VCLRFVSVGAFVNATSSYVLKLSKSVHDSAIEGGGDGGRSH